MLMLRRFFLYLAAIALLVAAPAGQQPDVETVGPKVGTRVPDFSGIDQFGRAQTLETVVGSEGAMLVFFRSADW